MCTYERKASLREFYGGLLYITAYDAIAINTTVIDWASYILSATIYPSLKQLHRGITDVEEQKQRASCQETYKKNANEEQRDLSDIDLEREEECGICLDTKTKVVLPNCNHAMCMDCYREWNARSESCPFCRDSLKRVNSTDLWVFMSSGEVIDMETLNRENLRRLFNYIDNLPLIVPETVFYVYDSHYDSYMK
eukprot:TRINITY_DN2278_c0_g2_i1.p1 TRINITY_DN2278_c0_g2~~TRINITY_DN2278_c0_g2_i1.p1  ORF type:complete len:194 (-),score=24.47 TRINITY_DN2278_c0_g2_i1:507-1088(-)